jgi:hypothetical protein
MASNYPPGHPMGVRHDECLREIYCCDPCNRVLELDELVQEGDKQLCSYCRGEVQRAECETCGQPATHIDYDRSVNYNAPMCSKHYL